MLSMRRLIALMPGLTARWPQWGSSGFPVPRTPALARLLGRARKGTGESGYHRSLLRLCGVEPGHGSDLPAAAVMRRARVAAVDQRYWLRLDPVQLQAGLDGLVLQPRSTLPLSDEEADRFGRLLAEVYDAPGETIEQHGDGGWYLGSERDPQVRTSALRDLPVAGGDSLLVTGAGARYWQRRLTELQMLLHEHPLNRLREQRGDPVFNSIWAWGGGLFPESVQAPAERLFGTDRTLVGVAAACGHRAESVPEGAAVLLQQGGRSSTALLVFEQFADAHLADDPWQWVAHLNAFESRWAVPLLRALRSGRLAKLDILPCDSTALAVTPVRAWRLWRRGAGLDVRP